MSDLTPSEQVNVRAALAYLRTRCGSLRLVGKVLRIKDRGISKLLAGHRPISAAMAFRIARLAKVGVDDVLTGRYPHGACPHCGREIWLRCA